MVFAPEGSGLMAIKKHFNWWTVIACAGWLFAFGLFVRTIERPWMEPEIAVAIVNGEPRFSFTGKLNESRRATHSSQIKRMELNNTEALVCEGGYPPFASDKEPRMYDLNEKRLLNADLDYWVETWDEQEYPNGCYAELGSGNLYAMITSWCPVEAPRECVSARVEWVQP